MRTVRKLVLGETWALPIGVAVAIGGAAAIRALAGGWWREAGGFVLLALVAAAYVAATRTSPKLRRAPRRREAPLELAPELGDRDPGLL
jgi:hypothetical protein